MRNNSSYFMTLEEKVDRIYHCLVTDPLDVNNEGLIDKVKRHEKEIAELQKTKSNKWDWTKIFKVLKIVKAV